MGARRVWRCFRAQHSSVLTGNAMLKFDYFRSCAQLSTHAEAESAINPRYVDAMGVTGAAIPTQEAIPRYVDAIGLKRYIPSRAQHKYKRMHAVCQCQ